MLHLFRALLITRPGMTESLKYGISEVCFIFMFKHLRLSAVKMKTNLCKKYLMTWKGAWRDEELHQNTATEAGTSSARASLLDYKCKGNNSFLDQMDDIVVHLYKSSANTCHTAAPSLTFSMNRAPWWIRPSSHKVVLWIIEGLKTHRVFFWFTV